MAGIPLSHGDVSGEDQNPPTVTLVGPGMEALVEAIPDVEARTGRPFTLVGGLAVLSRLGAAYRVTTDLDTVNRRAPDEKPQLEVLVESGGRRSGPAGVRISTPRGEVQVDVLEVSDHELERLPDDPTGRLSVLSHAWAAESATPMVITMAGPGGAPETDGVRTRVATPGPLIAMKLQAIMDRSAAKERTDLLDIIYLTLDSEAGPLARKQLREADPRLRHDAALHAHMWFVEHRWKSLRRINEVPGGRQIDGDEFDLVADLLLAELTG